MRKAKPWNRLLSLALCICMALSLLPGMPLPANAADTVETHEHMVNVSGICIQCGTVFPFRIDEVEKYFITMSDACTYAAQHMTRYTITVLSDAEVNTSAIDNLTINDGVTLTVNGMLTVSSFAKYGNVAGNGFVTVGETNYKVFANDLYLCAGGVDADWELSNVEYPTYWTAGEGYAAFNPHTHVLTVHNATINTEHGSSENAGLVYGQDLTVNFSGTNTLTTNDQNEGTMLFCQGDTVMNGIGEDAVLNIFSGYRSNVNDDEVWAAMFTNLTVKGGTVNIVSGNGTGSVAVDAASITVAEGAVFNAIAGNATTGYSVGIRTQRLTVDGTLNATSGSCGTGFNGSFSSDIMATSTIVCNGTINGLCQAVAMYISKIDYIVCGNTTASYDRVLMSYSSSPVTFAVPAGNTLTVAEGVTLNLTPADEIDFSGTVVNNGTIILPASYDINNAPKSGTVVIGDNSFVWNDQKWECVDESQHTGGQATCQNQAACELCGEPYGDYDDDNHAGGTDVKYEWSLYTDGTCYVNAELFCNGCDAYMDTASGYAELVEEVAAVNCQNPGSKTWSFTFTLNGEEYSQTHTETVYNDVHIAFDDNGFCTSCGGCQKPMVDPGEDPEWDYDDVYQIYNAGQLYWFANHVNNVNNGIYGKLMADIDLNPGFTFNADGSYSFNGIEGPFAGGIAGLEPPRMWTPIGSRCYAGNFDGNGHTVSGAYVVSEAKYVGLFGNTDYNYNITNLGITNSYFEGADHVGGLIGYAYTTVKNCYVTDTVYVSGSHATAAFIGYNGGEIYNSYAMADTFVDNNYGSCYNCYALTESDGVTALSAEDFASGKAAYLLQGEQETTIWGQTIDTDQYPVLNGDKVYQVLACDGVTSTYSNTDEQQDHSRSVTFIDMDTHYASCSNCDYQGTEAHSKDDGIACDCMSSGWFRFNEAWYYVDPDTRQMAKGDVTVSCGADEHDFVIGGVYTFDANGALCEYDGITDVDGVLRYYEDAQLMCGAGVIMYGVSGVTLVSYGDQKMEIIKVVRNYLGIGLLEAKKLVESAPVVLTSDIAMSDAIALTNELVSNGATAHYSSGYGYVTEDGSLAVSMKCWVEKTNGYDIPVDEYEFNEHGNMIFTECHYKGHTWTEASCTAPKTCSACGRTDGETPGHDWIDATCTTPKTCSVCGLTEEDDQIHEFDILTGQCICGRQYAAAVIDRDGKITCHDDAEAALALAINATATVRLYQDVTVTKSINCGSQCGTVYLHGHTITLAEGCTLKLFAATIDGSDGNGGAAGAIIGNAADSLLYSPRLSNITVTNTHAQGYAFGGGGMARSPIPAEGVSLNGGAADIYITSAYFFLTFPDNDYRGEPIHIASEYTGKIAYAGDGKASADWFTCDEGFVIVKKEADPNNVYLYYDVGSQQATLSQSQFCADGTERMPTITVTHGDTVLTQDTDYTVTWPEDTVSVGEKTVILTGKGNYSGTLTLTYAVQPHRYENGFCACGAEEKPFVAADLKFSGASLTLEDDLTINFKVKPELLEAGGYSDPYAVFVMNGKETVIRDYTLENGRYVFAFKNVSPNRMGDTVTATLYATKDGEVYESAPITYSAATYCYNMLAKCSADSYAKLRTLLVDLLNYGAASQLYVSYNTENLVNAALTEEQKGWATATDRELTSVLDQEYATVQNPTVQWKGAGLVLQESIVMRFKFKAESVENLSVKIVNGTESIITEFEQTEDGYYLFCDKLHAAQMSEPVYVTVYDGDTALSNTVRYSIESYAASKITSEDTTLVNLLKAMMKYGDTAVAYKN